jgi:hypothetical protein
MVDIIVFYVIFPMLFSGICILGWWIRVNSRYDVMFNINWEAMVEENRVKLLKLLTIAVMIFGFVSMAYFPFCYTISMDPPLVLVIYFAFVAVMIIIVLSLIARYAKWRL